MAVVVAGLTTESAATERLLPPVPPPAPEDLPWWRIVAAFRTNVLASWPRSAYEEPVLARRFFGRASLVINDPQAIREVLVDRHSDFERTRATIRILRPLLGDGLFISAGENWRHQRRTLAPAFTPRATLLLAPHILQAAREAVATLAARAGQPVDLLAAVQHLTLEIASRTMFSLEIGRYGAALRRLVAEYAEGMGAPGLLDFLLPLSVPSPQDLARRRFQRRWMTLFDEIIAARQDAPETGAPRDLFDLMRQARDPETGTAFSPIQLRDQMATMITAGHETTGIALFWALYLLALAPAAQSRVAAEAASAPLHGDGAEALAALPYTRAVIDETMRLYPPAFAVVRASRGADRLLGLKIERGSLIVIAPWLLHRHRRLWQEPNAFDPNRFLPGTPPIDRFAYLPFGVGPRVCIGAHFALTEATLVLASLVRAFDITIESRRPVLPICIVTTQPDHAPEFRLTPR